MDLNSTVCDVSFLGESGTREQIHSQRHVCVNCAEIYLLNELLHLPLAEVISASC